MDIFDLVDFGSSIINAGRAHKGETKLKNEYPFAYQLYLSLSMACLNSKISFKPSGTTDGEVFQKGDMLLKGIFSSSNLNCIAKVIPEENKVFIGYKILKSDFVVDNHMYFYLSNWINRRLAFGKLRPAGIVRNNVGKLVRGMMLVIEIPCDNVPENYWTPLFDNALKTLIDFHELYTPMVQAVADFDMDILINADGEISGRSNSALINDMMTSITRIKALPPEVVTGNLKLVNKVFSELGYEISSYPGEQFSTVYIPPSAETRNMDGMFHVIVSHQNELVFQSYSAPIEDGNGIIQTSEHMDFLNRKMTGMFFYHHDLKRVVYRNAFPLQNMKRMPNELIGHLVKEQLLACSLNLISFQFVTKRDEAPEAIIGGMRDGAALDYSNFPNSPAV